MPKGRTQRCKALSAASPAGKALVACAAYQHAIEGSSMGLTVCELFLKLLSIPLNTQFSALQQRFVEGSGLWLPLKPPDKKGRFFADLDVSRHRASNRPRFCPQGC